MMENVMMKAEDCRDRTKRPTIPQIVERLHAGLDEVEATLSRTLSTVEGPAGDACRGEESPPCCLQDAMGSLAARVERISSLARRLDQNFNQ